MGVLALAVVVAVVIGCNKEKAERRMALDLYLEGLGFRAIGRVLGISYGTVYRWIKKWGEQVELPVGDGCVPVVELDEMHSYVQSKKTQMDMDSK